MGKRLAEAERMREFTNEKGDTCMYRKDLRSKRILNFAMKGAGSPNNAGSNSYYWANGYKRGDWGRGGWYSHPSEPNGNFPDVIVDIEEGVVYMKD